MIKVHFFIHCVTGLHWKNWWRKVSSESARSITGFVNPRGTRVKYSLIEKYLSMRLTLQWDKSYGM